MTLLKSVKANLIIEHDEDDELLEMYISAAISYAESYQHLKEGYYNENEISPITKQAVIMLSSHFYESRDGGTGGFYSDTALAGEKARETINNLLRLDKDWKV